VPENAYHTPRDGSARAEAAEVHHLPPGWFAELRGTRRPRVTFKWLNFWSLVQSRNDVVARLHDPVNDMRREWMAHLADPPPAIDRARPDGRCRLLVVGDPGEGDSSQWALIPAVLRLAERSDFMVVCSDVIYPTGDVNDYPEKFFAPYARYGKPIFALPGNHDWYDELQGFAFNFCDRRPPRRSMRSHLPFYLRPLWRRPRRLRRGTREARDAFSGRPDVAQPAPYWAMDLGPLVLVAIDTGISGEIDREQARWLRRVSSEVDKPKVLLTGKPLVVDGQRHRGAIEGEPTLTVDHVVRDRDHRYVAAIGGDIHNYQRYPIRLDDGRRIEYVVAGGGGAFMHATHRIGPVDVGNVSEQHRDADPAPGDSFRCFPLRGASLAFYVRVVRPELRRLIYRAATVAAVSAPLAGVFLGLWAPRWWALVVGIPSALAALVSLVALAYVASLRGFRICFKHRATTLTTQEAATWLADEARADPTRGDRLTLSEDQRELAKLIAPRFHRTRGPLHAFFSEIFDIDDPPLFKQLLQLEVEPDALTISCYVAVGTEAEDDEPALEDQVRIPLAQRAGA
jgi:hypothetical protein